MPLPKSQSAPAHEKFAAPPAAPATGQAALLERIDARLERIEARLAKLDPLIDAAPALFAVAVDTFDETAGDLGDADERVRKLVALAERITQPETLAHLHAVLELLDTAPSLLSIGVDTLDELAREAAARGLPLERLVPELGHAIEAALRLFANAEIRALLGSDLFMPDAVEALGRAARALATATRAPETSVGLLRTLAALREPEVRRAVGFAIDVARRFGANIDQRQLPEGSQ